MIRRLTDGESAEWTAAMLSAYADPKRPKTQYYWERLNAGRVERLPIQQIFESMQRESQLVLLFDPNPQNTVDSAKVAKLFGLDTTSDIMGQPADFVPIKDAVFADFYLFPCSLASLMVASHEDDAESGQRVCHKFISL